jgi:hypothetical protein
LAAAESDVGREAAGVFPAATEVTVGEPGNADTAEMAPVTLSLAVADPSSEKPRAIMAGLTRLFVGGTLPPGRTTGAASGVAIRAAKAICY